MSSYAEKIQALLAQAEGTDNPHEAETYTAKAEELMVKWGVSDAQLADKRRKQKKGAEKIVEKRVRITGSFCRGEVHLGFAVARGLGIRSLKSNGRPGEGTMVQYVYLIGHESDVARAETLLASLRLQVVSARWAWWKGYDQKAYMTTNEQYLAKRQFVISFASAVESRLVATSQSVHEEAISSEPGTELVLVDRAEKVDEWLHAKYPKLGNGRGINHSYAGHAEGHAAGQKASLGGTEVDGSRQGIDQ